MTKRCKTGDKEQDAREAARGRYYYAKPFEKECNQIHPIIENRIVCGDSGKVLKLLPDNCIDLILTSPPYNFGIQYAGDDDTIRWQAYFEQLFGILRECVRVLKFGGRIAVNVQPCFSDYIPTHHMISSFFLESGLIWRGEILWEKNNYNCKYTAWGSWKSPSNPYLKYTWEFIEVFSKGSIGKKGRKEDIDITSEEFKKWVVAKWVMSPERKMAELGHPAMFPEELAYRVIRLFSYRNDIVLDPFNGVGTTTLVAGNLGRRFIGIDIDEGYCNKALKRLGASK